MEGDLQYCVAPPGSAPQQHVVLQWKQADKQGITEDRVREACAPFGAVEHVEVQRRQRRAFITLADIHAAIGLVGALDGTKVPALGKAVTAGFALRQSAEQMEVMRIKEELQRGGDAVVPDLELHAGDPAVAAAAAQLASALPALESEWEQCGQYQSLHFRQVLSEPRGAEEDCAASHGWPAPVAALAEAASRLAGAPVNDVTLLRVPAGALQRCRHCAAHRASTAAQLLLLLCAGSGVPAHMDSHGRYGPAAAWLQLRSGLCVDFRGIDAAHRAQHVPEGACLVMVGEARLGWTRSVAPRRFDLFADQLARRADALVALCRQVRRR